MFFPGSWSGPSTSPSRIAPKPINRKLIFVLFFPLYECLFITLSYEYFRFMTSGFIFISFFSLSLFCIIIIVIFVVYVSLSLSCFFFLLCQNEITEANFYNNDATYHRSQLTARKLLKIACCTSLFSWHSLLCFFFSLHNNFSTVFLEKKSFITSIVINYLQFTFFPQIQPASTEV